MRLIAAILLGKLIAYLIKLTKIGGGSAAPGLYALKICPSLVTKLSQQIPKNIIITGTNGKTTTSKLLAHFAQTSGFKVIRNHTGSNLERGIASALLSHLHFIHPIIHPRGDRRLTLQENLSSLGIWELDEAAFNTVAPKLHPDIIIFLNVFRDQLDRYGEIDTVVKNWCQTLKGISPDTLVLVNGDDINTAKLTQCLKGNVQKFGVKDYKIIGESIERRKEQQNLDFEAKNIKLNGLNSSSFQLHTTRFARSARRANYQLPTTLPLPGFYHIYDFLASFAAGLALGLDPKQIITSLKSYSPAFGRVEKLPFGYIFLIKNPAGAISVFETITPNIKPNDRLLLALNDNIADGTDISWIWDANFETLRTTNYELRTICSGTRAYDLAVRLKYAGFPADTLNVEPDLQKALRQARTGLTGRLFILPTYTAMLELQSILTKSGLKKHYWEEG